MSFLFFFIELCLFVCYLCYAYDMPLQILIDNFEHFCMIEWTSIFSDTFAYQLIYMAAFFRAFEFVFLSVFLYLMYGTLYLLCNLIDAFV